MSDEADTKLSPTEATTSASSSSSSSSHHHHHDDDDEGEGEGEDSPVVRKIVGIENEAEGEVEDGGDHVVADTAALESVEGEGRREPKSLSTSSSLSSLNNNQQHGQQQQRDQNEEQRRLQQQQTRFSFYDAREVQLQYNSSMPTKDDSDNGEQQQQRGAGGGGGVESRNHHQRFHFYDPSIMPVSATTPSSAFINRDRNRMGDTIKEGGGRMTYYGGGSTGGGGTSSIDGDADGGLTTGGNNNRERLTASGRKQPKPLSIAEPSHADEILRSLQETEEQRLNILKKSKKKTNTLASMMPGDKNDNNNNNKQQAHPPQNLSKSSTSQNATSPSARNSENFAIHTTGDSNNAYDGDGNSNTGTNTAANPYEDAIKEALVLLRKHRSPPGSPSQSPVASKHNPDSEISNSQLHSRAVSASKSRDEEGAPEMVQADGDDVISDDPEQKTHAALNSSSNADPSENITGALQEAKLKAKKRQERMAEYASRLQEFKSSLPPEQQLKIQPSSSYNSQDDGSDDDDDHDDHNNPANTNAAATPTSQQVSVREWVPSDERRQQYPKNDNEDEFEGRVDQPLFIQHVTSTDSAGIISELSHSTKPVPSFQRNSSQSVSPRYGPPDDDRQRTVEAEVQKGVEKVLLAILEASRSKGEANTATGDKNLSNDSVRGNDAASAASNSQVSEALLRVMDEVLYKSSGTNDDCRSIDREDQGTNKRLVTNDYDGSSSSVTKRSLGGKSQASYLSKQSGGERSSVVDELLAEGDDMYGSDRMSLGQHHARQPLSNNSNARTLEEKKATNESVPNQKSKGSIGTVKSTLLNDGSFRHSTTPDEQEVGIDNDLISEEYDGEDLSTRDDEDEHDDLHSDVDDDVHDDIDENEDGTVDTSDDDQQRGAVLGPLSRRAGGTTGIVLDGSGTVSEDDVSGSNDYFSSVVNYVTSALTPEQQQSMEDNSDEVTRENTDTTAANSYQEERYPPGVDSDSMDLMRTLCAHLLPFGVDRSSDFRESLPEWDESNENEAGYRIIRLSRSQLRLVERAFEVMITGLKNTSQSQLNGLEGEYDANFIRELQEAERLLDDQERRLDTTKSQTKSTSGPSILPSVSTNLDTNGAETDDGVDNSVDSDEGHPDFPGVKGTGRGEMGDLEYFHLPIIFKSHVTGFEPTKDMALEAGNVVAGQYLVESELGSAAFSTAYRCIDLSSDNQDGHEEVCLKVIKNTKDFFDQSLDEIKILELLRQTGKCDENFIVRMKTFFYYREHLIIVTELLRQNLFEFGKFIIDNDEEPYFTIPRLAYISRQCLIALRFVHGLGLVHSDVKPENILLSSYSRAKIKVIDFGSSCYLTDRQSSYIQSRSYRAPEVVLGLPYDGRIDVWSLGCVVAEMFTGEVTFQNDSIVSMLSRIEAICGSFPRHMIAQGRQSGRFFTKSGLLYEVVDDSGDETRKNPPGPDESGDESDSESDTSVLFDIFQPKNTRLAARLGFEADLMDDYKPNNIPSGELTDFELEQLFTDFVGRLLTIDPDGRPSADDALGHPLMQYASTLSEEKIKYPSN